LLFLVAPKTATGQTYDFDEGIRILASGLISKKEEVLKNKKIAVFGIVESKTSEQWEITTHIEDGIVDALVNEGYTVVERRRIEDVLKKEIKKSTDLWFDEAQVAQFGKLVGADMVITGKYSRWGKNILRINVRGITVSDGKVLAANKVNVHTDRIEELLTPDKPKQKKEDGPKKDLPGSPSSEPSAKDTQQAPSQQQPPAYQEKAPYQQPPYPPQNQYAPPTYPSTPEYGYFCCDQFGVRRCQLAQPGIIGTPCFCYGLGWGYICP
jgi:TolB-like protein